MWYNIRDIMYILFSSGKYYSLLRKLSFSASRSYIISKLNQIKTEFEPVIRGSLYFVLNYKVILSLVIILYSLYSRIIFIVWWRFRVLSWHAANEMKSLIPFYSSLYTLKKKKIKLSFFQLTLLWHEVATFLCHLLVENQS